MARKVRVEGARPADGKVEQKVRGKYGNGVVFKRGRVWWIRYYAGTPATRREESTKSHRERDAWTLLRARLADKDAGRPLPVTRLCTFDDLVGLLRDDYQVKGNVSWSTVEQAVEHLKNVFGDDRAEAITADRVKAYQAARLKAGAAPATLHKEVSALQRMFKLGLRLGRVRQVPYIENPTPDNARKGFFSEDELARVLANLLEPVAALTLFARITGWRKGEVLGLTWDRVDLQARTVRLEPGTTKNREGRTFAYNEGSELEVVLRGRWEATKALGRLPLTPWVFHHRGGKPVRSFHQAWRAACLKAKCPDRLFHDLRRTAVMEWERAGVARSVAMRMSGHKTESIYRRYAIVVEKDLRDAAQRADEWRSEQRRKVSPR